MPATAPSRSDRPAGPATWPTTAEALRRLGISRAQLRRLGDEGRLRGQTDDRGHWRWRPEDVEREALRRANLPAAKVAAPPEDGEVAARVFRRLASGDDPVTIVTEEKIPPSVLDGYRASFAAYRGQLVIPIEGPMRTLLDRLAVESDRPAGQELLDCFERHVAEQRARHAQERARIEAAHADERTRLEADVKSLTDQLKKSTAALAEAGERIRAQQAEIEQLGQLGLAAAAKVAELQAQLAARAPAPPTETPPEPGPSDPTVS